MADFPPLIEGVTFEKCTIVGPAVLASVDGSITLTRGKWDVPFDNLLWPISPDRPQPIVGAIGLVDCHFFDCTFLGIGLAIPEEHVERFRAGFQG